MFIGREVELGNLNKEFENSEFSFTVIYGRRRVGKTFLIHKFIEDKPGAYFVSVESNEIINLTNLSKAVYKACKYPQNMPSFDSFESAFDFLFTYSLENRMVFVIDEYPYLASGSSYISSLLQKYIDMYRDRSKLFLILCGSSMSFMENQVLGAKSPLYGRRTSQYKILPFRYPESRQFIKDMSDKDASIVYGITGGVAEYLTYFDDHISLRDNIIRLLLSPNGRLYEEPSSLLKQELRDPKTYNDIIYAVASGASKINEIATKLNIPSGGLNNYIKVLLELNILERRTPVLDKNSKRPVYVIKDYLFRFWFRFIQPNINHISLNIGETVYDSFVEKNLNEYMGHIFEDMSIQYLEDMVKKGNSGIIPLEYGNWWGTNKNTKKQEEIDWIAYSPDNCIFAECKWKNEPVRKDVLSDLKRKAELFESDEKEYWLFSLSGFTFKESKKVRLITLKDMYEV